MRLVIIILVCFSSVIAEASPQFEACAFEARIPEKPVKAGKKYNVKIEPTVRIRYKHDLWQDFDRFCPIFGKVSDIKIYLAPNTLDRMEKDVGKTVRLVIEYIDGYYDYETESVYDMEELKYWNAKEYTEVTNGKG